MAKLTARERAAYARQILAADDEDDDEPTEETAEETAEEDDDYVIYRGKKYRPEVAEEKKAEAAEGDETEATAPAAKPKKRRFVT